MRVHSPKVWPPSPSAENGVLSTRPESWSLRRNMTMSRIPQKACELTPGDRSSIKALTNKGISNGVANRSNSEQRHKARSVRHAQGLPDSADNCGCLDCYDYRVGHSARHTRCVCLAQENRRAFVSCGDWHKLLGKAYMV